MGIDYTTTVIWGTPCNDTLLGHYLNLYDDVEEVCPHYDLRESGWNVENLCWDDPVFSQHFFQSGDGYSGYGKEEFVGVCLGTSDYFSAIVLNSPNTPVLLQEAQREYENLAHYAEMLLGIRLPRQGILCVTTEKH